jgi:polysaccharide export outer membrane protein
LRFSPAKRSRSTASHAAPVLSRGCAAAFVLCSAGLILQGCALPALPRSAPTLDEVNQAKDHNRIVLAPVTPDVAASTRVPTTASFPASFLQARPIDYERFAPGDGIDVVVWERDGLQMFPPGANGGADLGSFTVGKDGVIHVPYVGSLNVAGLRPDDARQLLLRRLRGLVIATDVRLSLTDQHGSLVTVQGDVSKAGVYPMGPGMLRLSNALGVASPDQADPEQTVVTIRRDGASATVRLSDIYRDSAQDVALRPGDSIVVHSIQEYVKVLGAAGGQGRVKISKRNYTVLDAVADSRGLSDSTAYPRAVFLLRAPDRLDAAAAAAPVVYQFDMRYPDQMSLAGQFAVRDGDTVFISDAPYTQVQKVLSALSATLGTARSVSALGE